MVHQEPIWQAQLLASSQTVLPRQRGLSQAHIRRGSQQLGVCLPAPAVVHSLRLPTSSQLCLCLQFCSLWPQKSAGEGVTSACPSSRLHFWSDYSRDLMSSKHKCIPHVLLLSFHLPTLTAVWKFIIYFLPWVDFLLLQHLLPQTWQHSQS